MTSPATLEVLADQAAMAKYVADWLLALALAKNGSFAVCLSGGNTPRRLYETLAEYRDRFPWPRSHWFWGDERFVPHDDSRSNYRMVREALLWRAPIPAENIHAVPTEALDPDAAAAAYEGTLKSFYGAERFDPARPLFDVNLLGLGSDGHTASLFPGNAVLRERDMWVCAVSGAKPEARITLTACGVPCHRKREAKDPGETSAPRSKSSGGPPSPGRHVFRLRRCCCCRIGGCDYLTNCR